MKKYAQRLALLALASVSLAACQNSNPQLLRPAPGQVRSQNTAQSANFQVVELRWQNRAQVLEAATSGIDLFGANARTQTARARVTPEQANQLQRIGMQLQPVIEPQMERGGLPSGYMTYAEMTAKLQGMVQQYPHLVTLEDVGDTHLKKTGAAPNHEIWAVSISNRKALGRKPTLMLTAGVHARELAPVELVMKLAEELTSQYGKDPEITKLMDTREVILLPMVNVDGRVEVEKGDSWKRKNMNTSRGDGVDLNRNFDTHWNYSGLDVPSSWLRQLTSPTSQTYSGTAPASEPETQAIQNMYSRKKINMSVDIHAYGEMFFWPLGFQEAPIAEVDMYKNIYQNTFAKLGYQGGTSLQLLYPTSGTTDDYGYDKHHAFSMGMEVGNSFRPTYGEVETMWKKARSAWLGMIHYAGTTPN